MKDYLNLWFQELLRVTSLTLKSRITMTGESNRHLGPRWEFARVRVTVEPALYFEVVDATSGNEEARREGVLDRYLDWTIFGLLDVLMMDRHAPLRNIRIILEEIEIHPIDSSQMSFRNAGRDAGRKILESFRQSL